MSTSPWDIWYYPTKRGYNMSQREVYLGFMYPAIRYLEAKAEGRRQRNMDIALCCSVFLFGLAFGMEAARWILN